jgi:hypothetical protein
MFTVTNLCFITPLLLFATARFGYYSDPEKAPAFSFLLSMGTAITYCMMFRLYEGKMEGHGLGLVKLNGFGYSKGTSIISLSVLGAIFSFYLISIFLDYERGQIWGLSLIIALILATLSWKYHYYYSAWWVGDEKDASTDLEDYSFGDEDKTRFLSELKDRGLI